MIRIFLFLLTNLSIVSILFILGLFIKLNIYVFFFVIVSTFLTGFGGAIISLLLSKRIALFSVGGKIITDPANDREKWAFKKIKKQASKLNLKTPEFAIYDSDSFNAFATGATKNSSVVAVSTALLHKMRKNELEAVIAHEISHISNGDMVTMTLLQGILNTFTIFLSNGLSHMFCSMIFGEDNTSENLRQRKIGYHYYITLFLEIIFGILASFITMWFSRKREFYADAGAAKLSSIENMIAALKTLEYHAYLINEPKNVNALCINGSINNFFYLLASHPPINTRIKALNKKKYM
ncbi:protease HtpX [Buchnera aphidicola]|uniref:protease HtpX n=1 Tax=Buchnera aphidicola TaxID=9 RepID=UPI003463AFDC